MSIDFYYAPMSSASRVHWALEELGVPYNKIKVDFKSGQLQSAEYRALNPNGKVPLLVIDGKPLFESLAQIYYLGDRFGVEKQLWPSSSDPARLDALSWTAWGTVELAMTVYRYMLAVSPRVPDDRKTAAGTAAALAEVHARLAILEAHLVGRQYTLGDNFSLVDVANAAATAWMGSAGVDLAAYPNVAEWTARSTKRPALAATMTG